MDIYSTRVGLAFRRVSRVRMVTLANRVLQSKRFKDMLSRAYALDVPGYVL